MIIFLFIYLFLLLSITFIYLVIYLFIILLFIYLLLFYHSLIYLFIHLFNLIIWCFYRKIYQWRKKNFEIGKTLKMKGTLLGISEDHWRVKIGMKKFLEKMGLLMWYAWIDFLKKFKKDFPNGWDIEFGERKTHKVERLPIAIKSIA